MMTKKQFEGLADALSYGAGEYGFEFIASEVADFCATENPRFDRQKFLARVFKDDPEWPGHSQ